MNFIYTFFSFICCAIIFRIAPNLYPDPNAVSAFIFFSAASIVLSILTLLVSLFYQLSQMNLYKKHLNAIKKLNKNIKISNDYFITYKAEMTDKIMKIYPQYEKDIFALLNNSVIKDAKQNNTDANSNQLTNFTTALSQYPELKYSSIFQQYINKFETILSSESSLKREIGMYVEFILNIKEDGWMFKINTEKINIENLYDEKL